MKKIIFLLIAIIIGFFLYKKDNLVIIPNESIRIRIIANSNEIDDLLKKKNLKEELEEEIFSLMKNIKNINEARDFINKHQSDIDKIIKKNIDTNYNISYGLNYFPKKTYKGVLYPEGDYESLVITLGKGIGSNWWCVLFPPLCLIDDNENTSDVEYKFYIQEVLKRN